jgi:predicted lipase
MSSSSITNVEEIAYLNKLAYEINSQIEADAIEDKSKFKHVRYYINNETDAELVCFEKSENLKIIVFKGTDSKKDFKYDIDFIPFEVGKDCVETDFKLHRGFYEQFISLKEHLVEETKNRKVKIILTGHSLGAALATIAACYSFCNVPGSITQVVLFGSPRVLCKEFSEWYEKRLGTITIQIRNFFDPISHLPPTGNIFQYQHVEGTLIQIKNGNIVQNNSNCGIFKSFVNAMKGIVLRDHQMARYLRDIENHSFFKKIVF